MYIYIFYVTEYLVKGGGSASILFYFVYTRKERDSKYESGWVSGFRGVKVKIQVCFCDGIFWGVGVD